jgi:hypothetical protein
MITNELKIAKTNDIKGAYRLIERIQNGNALEAAQAHIEVSILNPEAQDRFFELIGRPTYWQYLATYLRILMHKEKVQKFIDRNVIHGDRLEQMLSASTIADHSEEDLATKFESGELREWMRYWEIRDIMGMPPNKIRRQTKRVKEEHAREFRSAHLEHLRANHCAH